MLIYYLSSNKWHIRAISRSDVLYTGQLSPCRPPGTHPHTSRHARLSLFVPGHGKGTAITERAPGGCAGNGAGTQVTGPVGVPRRFRALHHMQKFYIAGHCSHYRYVHMQHDIKKKIALLGDPAVGKTSLIRRYVIDRYDDKYISTLGTKVTKKMIEFNRDGGKTELTLIIWDVLGQREFRKIQDAAFEGAKGALVVFDVSRDETFDGIEYWVEGIRRISGDIPLIILGNKIDLVESFDASNAEAMAEYYGTKFFNTSAKTGLNVERAFLELGQLLLE